jgi:hypothetical protein
MPIKFSCACGQELIVKDEFAGRTGTCPVCKRPVAVPPGASGVPRPAPDNRTTRTGPAKPGRRAEEDPFDFGSPPRDDRLAGTRSPNPARREEDPFDFGTPGRDEGEEGRGPSSRFRRSGRVAQTSVVLLGVGIGLIVFLGLTPVFNLYFYSVSFVATDPSTKARVKELNEEVRKHPDTVPSVAGLIETWRGVLILVFSLLLAAAVTVCLVLLQAAPSGAADRVTIATGAACAGWGLLVLLYYFCLIVKGFAMSQSIEGGTNIDVKLRFIPGVGLWLGVLAAGGVLWLFCSLLSLRRALPWGGIGLGAAAFFGLLLVCLDVQPWDTEKSGPPSWVVPKARGRGGDGPSFGP